MIEEFKMKEEIVCAVNRLRHERELIENTYYRLGEEDGFFWSLSAPYNQILKVKSLDLKSIVKEEFFEDEDLHILEEGVDRDDFDENPYSDYLLNEFGDKYIDGFVTSVKDFWKNNKRKIR